MVDLGVDRGTVERYNPFTSTEICITICGMNEILHKVVFKKSASKHGFTEKQAVNAILEATRHQDNIDPQEPHQPPVNLAIGPAGPGTAGKELEVMYHLTEERIVIFHCMEARPRNKYTAIETI